jgi:ABC-type sugar transport system substrate-binding protein
MKRTSTMVTLAIGALASAALFAVATHAKDEAPVAQNVTTVFVPGKGQSGFAAKVNEMHAQMEAKGWKFGDMEVYSENGDMQGAFLTYVH